MKFRQATDPTTAVKHPSWVRMEHLHIDTAAGPQYVSIVLRLDTTNPKAIRVDVHKPLQPMWEAIDGGEPSKSRAAAVRKARAWLDAARSQRTLSPNIELER